VPLIDRHGFGGRERIRVEKRRRNVNCVRLMSHLGSSGRDVPAIHTVASGCVRDAES